MTCKLTTPKRMISHFFKALPLRIALIAAIAPAHISASAPAQAATLSPQASGHYTLDRNHASLTFTINHLGYSYTVGRFNVFDATLDLDATTLGKSHLKATVTPASVDMNNEKLESELVSPGYFNTAEFPEALFVSKKIMRTGENTGTLEGDLTFRGITKPLTFTVTFNQASINPYTSRYTIGFSAQGTMERSAWGMDILTPHISDTVTLRFEGEFQKSDENPSEDGKREGEENEKTEEEIRNERQRP